MTQKRYIANENFLLSDTIATQSVKNIKISNNLFYLTKVYYFSTSPIFLIVHSLSNIIAVNSGLVKFL